MSDDKIIRRFRVEMAARLKGIRLVPAESGPDFPRIPYACAERPKRCGECQIECRYIPDPREASR